nr:penicillin-binding transpeptidase domain-containing protein [uncultured Gemmiger sp.]
MSKRRRTTPSKKRLTALLVVGGAVFVLFAVRLFWMQFVMADHYAQKVAEASQTSYSVELPAARGDIVDRNGAVLARDDTVYNLNLCLPAPEGTDLQQTLTILRDYQLTDESGEDVETQLAAFFSAASAGELTVATGLDSTQAAALYAAGLPQSGAVRLVARGTRTWPDGTLLPHALGDTGPITTEQWQAGDYALREAGVAMNAEIGQSGLEQVYDALLRGQSGRIRVSAGFDGTRTETLAESPQPGATLVLTLDSALQKTVQTALQDRIQTLQTTAGAGSGRECNAGAAVVVDVTDGGVLAAASWPGYDLNTWRSDYAALAADSGAPLLDRVCAGLYAPGSAFKPAVAASALAAGLITVQDTVNCTGRYLYYSGYQPGCLQLGHSGPVSLLTALQHSCNIYFYDVGRRLGADAFSATAQLLGLAADTGAELPAAAGRLTWTSDGNYQDGLALQAAIGQGNTAVTPLQLAAYAAALADDGQRPALHFADRAVDAAGQTVWQFEPYTIAEAPGGEAVFAPIREGMVRMSQTLSALREAPVTLACKTGSPQRPEHMAGGSYYTNTVLIGYFPAESPRYAVAVVLEYGGGGANAAPIMRAIADALFG